MHELEWLGVCNVSGRLQQMWAQMQTVQLAKLHLSHVHFLYPAGTPTNNAQKSTALTNANTLPMP